MTERPLAEITPRGKQQARIRDIDRHIGMQLRQRRIMLGLTQMELAEALGVSSQQVHKYETGVSRLSASRLPSCARALGVGIHYFFEGLETTAGPCRPSEERRLLLELLRQFMMIRDRRHQEALVSATRMICQAD